MCSCQKNLEWTAGNIQKKCYFFKTPDYRDDSQLHMGKVDFSMYIDFPGHRQGSS